MIGCEGLISTFCFGSGILSRFPSDVSTNLIMRRMDPDSLSVTIAGEETSRLDGRHEEILVSPSSVLSQAQSSMASVELNLSSLLSASLSLSLLESSLSLSSASAKGLKSMSLFSTETKFRPSYTAMLAITKSSMAE